MMVIARRVGIHSRPAPNANRWAAGKKAEYQVYTLLYGAILRSHELVALRDSRMHRIGRYKQI